MSGHKYPPNYPPGTHWAIDKGWEVMDQIKPGRISDELRFLLAGQIAGMLMRMAHEPDSFRAEWEKQHAAAKKTGTG